MNNKIIQDVILSNNIVLLRELAQEHNDDVPKYKNIAAELNNYEAFLILHEYNKDTDPYLANRAIKSNCIPLFEFLVKHDIIDHNHSTSSTLANLAACYSNMYVLNILLKRGFRLSHNVYYMITYLILHSEIKMCSDRLEILRYLHDNKYSGAWNCRKGICYYCTERKIEEAQSLWIVESEIYDSSIQWLPKEMLEDTLELLFKYDY